MPRLRRRSGALAAPLLAATFAAIAIAGCGGSDDAGGGSESQARPAPSASLFPPADGRTLEQLLVASNGPANLVVSPAGKVLRVGKNRFPFGVFTVDRTQVSGAEIALYAAPGRNGPASGPYPARIEDLATKPAFQAKTTADDPDAAVIAYVSEVELPKPGTWNFIAMVRRDDAVQAVRLPTPDPVGRHDAVPAVGDKAPSVHTDTADQVGEIAEIDTRVPPSTMHEDDLADVLGKKPVVLQFATPALCQSRVCGPVVDVAEQVKSEFGDRVAFIHQEVYRDNDINKGLRPQLVAYKLPSEPWLFVIDAKGTISTVFEGPFSTGELTAAVDQVAGAPA